MPTYVLSKVKRTGAGQPVADLVDVDANANPPAALTSMGSGDHIVILDEDDGKAFKIITQSNFISQLNALVAATWARLTGVPNASTSQRGIVELDTVSQTLAGTGTNRAVTAAGVRAVRDALLGSAPGALDTLNELAAALGDDANFSATIMGLLADAERITANQLAVARGGTNASTPSGARSNLGLGTVATENTVPVSKGGTGATSAAAARTALGVRAASATVPVNRGGTGAGSDVQRAVHTWGWGARPLRTCGTDRRPNIMRLVPTTMTRLTTLSDHVRTNSPRTHIVSIGGSTGSQFEFNSRGFSAQISGGAGPYSYSWTVSGDANIPGQF